MRLLYLFFVLLLLNGCKSKTSMAKDNSLQRFDTEEIYDLNKELPALFPNIDSVCKYFNENMESNRINYNDVIDRLHYCFLQTEHSGLFGYNWFNGIVIADINNDDVFELYLNGSIGSGIIHSFIHCYDPAEDKYYIISDRHKMDYIAFVYKNNIYVYGSNSMLSTNKVGIKLFKPLFFNNELVLEELDNNLYNEIIDGFNFNNIYKLFSWDLTNDNYLK